MRDSNLKYYSMAYLFHLNGGIKSIISSKSSWDLYLSILLVLIAVVFHKIQPLDPTEAFFIIGLEIALLGLVLAIYAICAQVVTCIPACVDVFSLPVCLLCEGTGLGGCAVCLIASYVCYNDAEGVEHNCF